GGWRGGGAGAVGRLAGGQGLRGRDFARARARAARGRTRGARGRRRGRSAMSGGSSAAVDHSFFARPVTEVAPDLLGWTVRHEEAAGVIVETEAYHDSEPACHAYVGLTPRTEPLFGA